MKFCGFIAVFLLVLSGINASNSLEKYRERCLNRNSLYVILEEDEEYEDNELKTVGSVPFVNIEVKNSENTNKHCEENGDGMQNSQSMSINNTSDFIPPFVRTGSADNAGGNYGDPNRIRATLDHNFSFKYEEDASRDDFLIPGALSIEN